MQLSIGPMHLVHPVYVSPLELIPLHVDFKRSKVWAQVRELLTITFP